MEGDKDYNVISYYNDTLLLCAHPFALVYKNHGQPNQYSTKFALKEHDHEWCYNFYGGEKDLKMIDSNKMALLVHIIQLCKKLGEKIIVFSQTLCTLKLIQMTLQHIGLKVNTHFFKLEGKTPVEDRENMCQQFNDKNSEIR